MVSLVRSRSSSRRSTIGVARASAGGRPRELLKLGTCALPLPNAGWTSDAAALGTPSELDLARAGLRSPRTWALAELPLNTCGRV